MGRDMHVRLLLPPGWRRSTERTWPALYLLHGAFEQRGYASWTEHTRVEEMFKDVPAIVVMPAGGYSGFYSDWLVGAGRNWETFHLSELRTLVERRYHAGTRRVVAGLSMGGFGALSYAARHPKMFRAAASFSGVTHTQMDTHVGPTFLMGAIMNADVNPLDLWGDHVENADVWSAHNPTALVP